MVIGFEGSAGLLGWGAGLDFDMRGHVGFRVLGGVDPCERDSRALCRHTWDHSSPFSRRLRRLAKHGRFEMASANNVWELIYWAQMLLKVVNPKP